jgi:hypothetical protein
MLSIILYTVAGACLVMQAWLYRNLHKGERNVILNEKHAHIREALDSGCTVREARIRHGRRVMAFNEAGWLALRKEWEERDAAGDR